MPPHLKSVPPRRKSAPPRGKRPAWLERQSSEVRAVGWLSAPTPPPSSRRRFASQAPSCSGTVDNGALAEEREARATVEAELDACRAELALARAELEAARFDAETARAHHEEARTELENAAVTMTARTNELVELAEREILKLALAVAERVVGGEIRADSTILVAWVKEVIALGDFGEAMAIALSADVAAKLPTEAWGELGARVAVDNELPAGTCEVKDGPRVVTVSEHARLALVGEAVAAAQLRDAA